MSLTTQEQMIEDINGRLEDKFFLPKIKPIYKFEGACTSCKQEHTDKVITLHVSSTTVAENTGSPRTDKLYTLQLCNPCWTSVYGFMIAKKKEENDSNDAK